MIPAVCLVIFGLCFLLLLLIIIPIAGAAFSDDIKKALEKDAEERHEEQTASVSVVLIVLWFIIAICAGLLSIGQSITHRINLVLMQENFRLCPLFRFCSG